MTALDTNLLVRVITDDDPDQVRRAERLLASDDAFVPVTVLLETGWVLEVSYELSRSVVADSLRRFLGMKNVRVERPQRIDSALRWYEAGMDFADAFHLALSQETDRMATFDRAFAAEAEGKGRCPVFNPGET